MKFNRCSFPSPLSCAHSFLVFPLPSSLYSWQWQGLDKHTPSPCNTPSPGPRGAFCLTRLDICFLKSIVCLKRTSPTICFRGLSAHTHTHIALSLPCWSSTLNICWVYDPAFSSRAPERRCRGPPEAPQTAGGLTLGSAPFLLSPPSLPLSLFCLINR